VWRRQDLNADWSFFLISAHQNIHRFLYAYLSDEYISYLKDPSTVLLDDNCFLKVWESREYDHCKPDDQVGEAAELKAMINFKGGGGDETVDT
jgi:hypothetical protein